MTTINAKLARQQQAIQATKTSIAKIEELAKKSKDEKYRINCNLVVAQLRTKLQRQLTAVKLTEFQLDLGLNQD